MYKLYASFEGEAPTRVKHALKARALAETLAKRILASYVEVRQTLPSGKEALISIIRGGYLV